MATKIIVSFSFAVLMFAAAAAAQTGSGLEKHYRVLPVPRGPLESTQKNTLVGDTVKDKDGKDVGTLENVLVDSGTGKIEVAVLGYRTASGTIALTPVSWRNLHIDEKGEVHLKLSERDIVPGTITKDVKDMSPDVEKIMQGLQEQGKK